MSPTYGPSFLRTPTNIQPCTFASHLIHPFPHPQTGIRADLLRFRKHDIRCRPVFPHRSLTCPALPCPANYTPALVLVPAFLARHLTHPVNPIPFSPSHAPVAQPRATSAPLSPCIHSSRFVPNHVMGAVRVDPILTICSFPFASISASTVFTTASLVR